MAITFGTITAEAKARWAQDYKNQMASNAFDTFMNPPTKTSLQLRAAKEENPRLREIKEMFADSLAPQKLTKARLDIAVASIRANQELQAFQLQTAANLSAANLAANIQAHES